MNLVESLCSFSSYYYYHYQMRRFIQWRWLLCCSVVLSVVHNKTPKTWLLAKKKSRIAKSLHSADFVSIISKLLVKKWKWEEEKWRKMKMSPFACASSSSSSLLSSSFSYSFHFFLPFSSLNWQLPLQKL